MTPALEIIIPVRNPGTVFLQTIASLVAQTDRRMAVLLSDNFSTTGLEILDEAEKQLAAAGIPVRRVKPPYELKRVEHWNWAHSAAQGDWLKPLFVGDLLKPLYVERILERIAGQPAAQIIRCEFEMKSPDKLVISQSHFTGTTISPEDFLAKYMEIGNWLGGPINVCYRRVAWQAAGGYAIQMPACADVNLYFRLALERGLETVHDCLATFQLHDQRFSHGIAKRRVNGCFEVWMILRQARNYCISRQQPFPHRGVFRGAWRQFKTDYWAPWKDRVKARLGKK